MTVEHDIEQTPAVIDGLICAYLLDGEGGGKALDWAGVRAWKPSGGLLWVHLDRMAKPARDWLLNESGIAKVIDESLLADETRPRILADGGALVVFLRGVNLNPGADPEDMVDVRCHIENNRIVTLRDARLMAINDLREAIGNGVGPKTPGEFLVDMGDRLIDRMGPVIGGQPLHRGRGGHTVVTNGMDPHFGLVIVGGQHELALPVRGQENRLSLQRSRPGVG